MPRHLHEKSTVEQIRQRFDADVERFSVLETGQQAAMDAAVILEVVARSAAEHVQPGGALLDVGCGAGNFTLRLLGKVAPLDCVLVDLSQPMLERAEQRVKAATTGSVRTIQSDMRLLSFPPASFDVILAGQTLHHLREDAEWETMFTRFYEWLRPAGTLFVADLIAHDDPAIQQVMMERYSEHLEKLGGAEYRDKVLAYCEMEDSPRSVRYQLDLLSKVGFGDTMFFTRTLCLRLFMAGSEQGHGTLISSIESPCRWHPNDTIGTPLTKSMYIVHCIPIKYQLL